MKKVLAMIALIFGASSIAQAGMLVEPYIGYEMGDFIRQATNGGTEYKDKTSGSAFGLRLGYKFLLPWVSLDYTSGSGTTKSGQDGVADADYTKSALGAVVGVDLPLIRGWVGYGFSNDVTQKGDTNDTKFKGTYTKVGVGFGFIPFVSLNAEYKINNFDKYESGGTDWTVSDDFSTLKHDTIMISVSAPFNL